MFTALLAAALDPTSSLFVRASLRVVVSFLGGVEVPEDPPIVRTLAPRGSPPIFKTFGVVAGVGAMTGLGKAAADS